MPLWFFAWDVCGVQKKSSSQQTELFFPETQQYRTVAPELGLTFCRVRCFGCLLLHHRPPQSPGGLKHRQLAVPPHSGGWPSSSSAVFLLLSSGFSQGSASIGPLLGLGYPRDVQDGLSPYLGSLSFQRRTWTSYRVAGFQEKLPVLLGGELSGPPYSINQSKSQGQY